MPFVSNSQVIKKDSIIVSQGNNILLNGIKFDTLSIGKFEELRSALNQISFKTANIYLSGGGFHHTLAMTISGSALPLMTYFEKVRAGSRITFEKSVLVKEDGKVIAPYNKSIYFKE